MTNSTKGRPATFSNKAAKLAALRAIRDKDAENIPSRFLIAGLVDAGLVKLVEEQVEGKRGRGRPRHVPMLAGTANMWVANMERAAARAAEKAAAAAPVETVEA